MNISVILANPHRGSFNHAITQTVLDTLKKNRHTVFFPDLYDERFDPVLPFVEIPRDAELDPIIACPCREIAKADRIHHPPKLVGPAAGNPEGLDRPCDPACHCLPLT